MNWDEHRAFLRSRPSREGLAHLAHAVSAGSRAVNVRRLGGGLGSATHSLDLETKGGKRLPLVLKRFQAGDITAKLEWERLNFARDLQVPTPEPVMLDADGDWFGTPALVMSRLVGRAYVTPKHLDGWLDEIANALVSIHRAPLNSASPALRKPHGVEDWKRPNLRHGKLIDEAIASVEKHLPAALKAKRAIGHGDFHPGNLVWSRGQLTGVIDWSATRICPRAYEVAYCRADLTILIGLHAAERFLEKYEQVWGKTLGEDLSVWDLICALNAMRWGRYWVMAYQEQGRTDITARHVSPRAVTLLRSALVQLG